MTKHIAAYASAHFGKTLLWGFFNTFFLFFTIYGLGLDPIPASVLVFTFAIADALFDIPAALLIHKAERRGTTMFKWVAFAAPLCGLALGFSFLIIEDHPFQMVGVSLAVGIVFRLGFTFIDVPLNASIGRADFSSRGRNYVVAGRSLASTGARLLLALATALYLEQDGEINTHRLFSAGLFIGLFAPLLIIPAFRIVDLDARRIEQQIKRSSPTFERSVLQLFFSKNLILLGVANMALLVLASQLGHAVIFLTEEASGLNFSFSSALTLMTIVSAVSVWPWMAMASHFEKVPAALVCIAVVVAVVISFPLTATSKIGFAIALAAYAACSHVGSFVWSILPDLVDEITIQTGHPAHALVVGIFAAIGKLMIGVAGLISGWILEFSGFPDSPNTEAYILVVSCTTVVGLLLTAIFLFRVRISHSAQAAYTSSAVARADVNARV